MQGSHRFGPVFKALTRMIADVGLGGAHEWGYELSKHLGFPLGRKPDLTKMTCLEPEFQQLPGLERGRKRPAGKYRGVLSFIRHDQAVGNERLELESAEPASPKKIGPGYRFTLRVQCWWLGIDGSWVLAPLPHGQLRFDDFQRKKVIPLQTQDVPEPFDFGRAEQPIAGAGATRAYKALGFEKPDLRYGHVGVVVTQKVDDVTD